MKKWTSTKDKNDWLTLYIIYTNILRYFESLWIFKQEVKRKNTWLRLVKGRYKSSGFKTIHKTKKYKYNEREAQSIENVFKFKDLWLIFHMS